ncbi:ATP-dependent helicase [Erythrobacter aureus]|uniref:ATP-dependent helicase n=1 Tax=Erythrobacter aureus TaxID=2182384 RepID=UPI0013B365B1|nr:ATP-dependent helicase [Erythrobacter aureus]
MNDELIADLNPSQREAVLHTDGPAVVIAGPGSGKTKTLTKRAARLVQSGIAPERILLITFSRASAKEMLSRAKALDNRCQFISGGTFHATATKVINQNAHVFGADKPFTILDPEDVTEIVKRIIAPLKEGDKRNWPRASTIAKIISFAANTKLPIEEAIERKNADYLEFVDEISQTRDLFTTYKLDKGLLDYDDCLIYFAALLEDPTIGPLVRRNWSHIMVDEYQDTNALQLDIVYGLAGEQQNVLIVGDPGQSIYGFRGSAPDTMVGFIKRFPQTRVIKLETNYRSAQEIVDIVNAIDADMEIGFERTLRSNQGPSKSKPEVREVADNVAEAGAIADAIIEDKNEGGEVSNHAVLVRSMSYARRIEAEFISRQIPYRVVGGIRIDEAAHIKDLLSIARVSVNPEHEPAWLRLIQRYPRIGPKSADQIVEQLSKVTDTAEAKRILAKEEAARKTSFDGLGYALSALASSAPPADLLGNVAAIMDPFWETVWKDDWADRRKDIDAVLLIAAEHHTLDDFLTAITLDHSLEKKAAEASQKTDEKPVTISTVHGAKGLEWPTVHCPSFIRGHMPSNYAQSPEDFGEEMRIFYVAVSRAMKNLFFYKPAYDASGSFTTPSDYERLIAPYVSFERLVNQSIPVAGGAVKTNARIDMRSKLLGHVPHN